MLRRILPVLVVLFLTPSVAQASLSGGFISTTVGPVLPNSFTANVWVVTSGGSCSARQSSATTLALASTASKCTSWPAAYQLANNSDVVGIQATGSSYGTQTFSSCNTGLAGSNKIAPNGTEVTFQPESGNVAVDLNVTGSCRFDMTFKNINSCPDLGVNGASDIHFVSISCTNGVAFNGAGDSYLSYQTSNFGPFTAGCSQTPKLLMIWGANNVLLEGNSFHDFLGTEGCSPGQHPDAIEACGTPCGGQPSTFNVTIRGNKFWNNACDSGRYQDSGDHDYLIENNMFGAAVQFEGGCAQSLAVSLTNLVVRNNLFAANIDPSVTHTDNRWDNNIFLVGQSGTAYTCISGITSMKNNIGMTGSPTTCGTSQPNTVVSSTSGWFASPSTGDYHLTSCSLAPNNAGDSASSSSIDIDNGTRGNPPDIGPDECGVP